MGTNIINLIQENMFNNIVDFNNCTTNTIKNKITKISVEISSKTIPKDKLFDIYFYENGQNLNKNMVIDDKDKESLKKINRNAVSKTYLIAKIQIERELKTLINAYKLKG